MMGLLLSLLLRLLINSQSGAIASLALFVMAVWWYRRRDGAICRNTTDRERRGMRKNVGRHGNT